MKRYDNYVLVGDRRGEEYFLEPNHKESDYPDRIEGTFYQSERPKESGYFHCKDSDTYIRVYHGITVGRWIDEPKKEWK